MARPGLLSALILWGASAITLVTVAVLAVTGSETKAPPAEETLPIIPVALPEMPDGKQFECLALAIYHEARSEPGPGPRAVGHVVLNRVEDTRFPDTVCKVVKQGGETPPCQFSWWCDGKPDRPIYPRLYERSRILAFLLLTEEDEDPTEGAVFFHADYVTPYWVGSFDRTAEIGRHYFYK
ncbi:cell wall hydrolase [Parvularcula marina]|uniref:Cell wall hydrolase n=1 Tax=Parvularcula marina TaxID=2292771 RepID=A0A371R812_9PROT|nr:cell wall hydrolase [Parvularcula marina]RFB01604.1 cell wall hydrolase [Parvularcula marina]